MKKYFALAALLIAVAGLAHSDAGKKSSLFTFQQTLVQTGTLAETPLFTPADGGDFIVTVYAEYVSGVGTGCAGIGYTNDNQTFVAPFGPGGCLNGGFDVVVHAKPGTPVTVAANIDPGVTYNIFVTAYGQ